MRLGEVITATAAIAAFYTDHATTTAGGDPAFTGGTPATVFAFDGDVFVGAAQIRRRNGLLVFGSAASGEECCGQECDADAHGVFVHVG